MTNTQDDELWQQVHDFFVKNDASLTRDTEFVVQLIQDRERQARISELKSWLPIAELWSQEGINGPINQFRERIATLTNQKPNKEDSHAVRD